MAYDEQGMLTLGLDGSTQPVCVLAKRADNTDTLSGVYGSYDPYFILDTRIKYQATKNVGLSFSLNNLLDRNYFSYYQQAGRTFYGDISYSF
jgi:outer membrane receptor protein involved in Fe transport